MYLTVYNWFLSLSTPLIKAHIKKRLAEGKEDENRYEERFGDPGRQRPAGELLWIHAASVGESMSTLPLIQNLLARNSNRTIMLTTGSVTSARLMEERLPAGAFHQYIPIDTKEAVRRFLDYWQPQAAIWLESEIWPNLITQTKRRQIPMLLVNARMTSKSFNMWRKTGSMIKKLIKCFDYIHAQNQITADRLEYFGAKNVETLGNLKFCSPPLPYQKDTFRVLRNATKERKCWLAASTHKGEEAVIAGVHLALKENFKSLLTIIVPRHPERAPEIRKKLEEAGFNVAQRSVREDIQETTDVYLADTIGELGLFYRLVDIVFIGGSLVEKGGQNPLEAARLDCAILFGADMSNFEDIAMDLLDNQAALQVSNGTELVTAASSLFSELRVRGKLAHNAREVVKSGEALLGHLSNQVEKAIAGNGK
ncbi:3-deoxy-D-manno-octulosonic acid transferase [Sneathiella glossodoripedis]|uniref:3-deoxy-D-manno-octulosonic acid transferase n=1 Tax=Sneathiella glossodoripedis TaxID=418853 RepID=UPI000471F222|nr:3-deoxy-D-manno-octulosonic acid transferase [Sneathiella glossodoripedis]